MFEVKDNLDLEIRNIDSLIKSHNINNCTINRNLRSFVVRIGDLLELLYSCGWINNLDYLRYCRLIDNRIIKLDNVYYGKD